MDGDLLNASRTQVTAAAASSGSAGRVVVLDAMKGLAICLVVLGHVTQGLQHMNVVAPDSLLAAVTLAGILAPLLAYFLVKRLGRDWLYAWPGPRRLAR